MESAVKYIIRKKVLGRVHVLEISGDEYAALEKARRVLINALSIEEKYEILIANFIEHERHLLHAAVGHAVRETTTYSGFFETRSGLNIRLVNLLTAAKLYLDQLPQHVADCVPEDTNAAARVTAQCRREYSEHFEYRFMEALRNHVQHRGMPIHEVIPNDSQVPINP